MNQNYNKTAGFNTSAKYVPINTANIVEQFEGAGYALKGVQWARVTKAEKSGYQKHLLTFAPPAMQVRQVGDAVPQIVLKNSYDGTTSFQLRLGFYRLVCANGLMVGSTFFTKSVRHVGANALLDAVQAATLVAEQAPMATERIVEMQRRVLTFGEQMRFASQAAQLIVPQGVMQVNSQDLLAVRRQADVGDDVWRTFNRIQENVMRGGLRYTSADANGRVVNRSVRGIRAIDRNIDVNIALWNMAEEFLKVG